MIALQDCNRISIMHLNFDLQRAEDPYCGSRRTSDSFTLEFLFIFRIFLSRASGIVKGYTPDYRVLGQG
jgi:hypothetical protein